MDSPFGDVVKERERAERTRTNAFLYCDQASTQCPSTKIVMSGYSQGGQLVHSAADKLVDSAAAKQVAAGECPPPFPILHLLEPT